MPTRTPKYKQLPTLLERLQAGQRWSIKRENGVPVHLQRWDGNREMPTCSVSLRLSGNMSSGPQKALVEAALTLEALSIERDALLPFMTTGKTVKGLLLQQAQNIETQTREIDQLQKEAAMSEREITHLRGELELKADLEDARDKALATVAKQGRELDRLRVDLKALRNLESAANLRVHELEKDVRTRNDQIARLSTALEAETAKASSEADARARTAGELDKALAIAPKVQRRAFFIIVACAGAVVLIYYAAFMGWIRPAGGQGR